MTNMTKMSRTIYYDVDGVILNFTEPFAKYWNKGLEENLWVGNPIEGNPKTFMFGYQPEIDDIAVLTAQLSIFHDVHENLPLMHPDIPDILSKLRSRYTIELVTAYPDKEKRLSNLLCHEIPYDKLTCNVHDKLSYIQKSEENGSLVIAIFEDGPHNLKQLLPHYGGKIWSPNKWNYLSFLKEDSRIRFYNDPSEWMEL